MNKYEITALNTFLSEWDISENDYNKILEMIEDDDESISIWEPFENYSSNKVIQFIEDLKDLLEQEFIERV